MAHAGGRPKYVPTEADHNTVRVMAASGFKHEEIALCLGDRGIDDKTLRKHFRRDLDTSMMKANAAIANKLYTEALNGNVACMTFWLKCRARWQEVVRYEHSGPDAGPVELSVNDGKTAREIIEDRIAGIAARIGSQEDSGRVDGDAV